MRGVAIVRKTIYGGVMSTQEDHSDIVLISMIIKDGVKNYDELARKFSACTGESEEESREHIEKMGREGKVGYYHSKWCQEDQVLMYYFTRWDPAVDGSFPESADYKKGVKYFKPLFRQRAQSARIPKTIVAGVSR